MKNIIKEIFLFTTILIYFIYCLKYNTYIKNQTIYSITIWVNKIIPTLLPTFIIVDLIYYSNIPYLINKYLHINYIYILSIVSGSPTNAYLLTKSNQNITKILSTTKYTSLLFTYSFLKNIYNFKIAIILIILNIISNIIITLIIKPPKIKPTIQTNNIFQVLIKSISTATNTLIVILGTIVFFNTLPINLVKNIYIKTAILSILEITSSLNNLILVKLPLNIKLLFTTISLSTCGLCIETQIKSIINDTYLNYKEYLIYRLLHLVIYLTLVLIFILL